MASTVQGALAPGRAEGARPGVWLTDLSLLAMALIWGVNFSVVKIGTHHFAPSAFSGLRVALASVVLAGIAVALRDHLPCVRDRWRLAGLGVLGHGLYQVCFIEGIARTTAGTAALVLAAGPAFIALVGRVRGSETLAPRAWGGIALQLLGMAGVVLGTAGQSAGAARGASPLGPALILFGALCWAIYSVLLKPYAERIHPLQVSAWTMFGGVTVLGFVTLPALLRTDFAAVPAAGWNALLYSGLLALVVAYLFYYRGVRVLGPTRTAMYANLQPLIALVVAYLTLGERPTAVQLSGAAAIMVGLLISRR